MFKRPGNYFLIFSGQVNHTPDLIISKTKILRRKIVIGGPRVQNQKFHVPIY